MGKTVALLWLALSIAPQPARIVQDQQGVFRVTGWDASHSESADWPKLLVVYVLPLKESSPAVTGDYSLERGELVFRARYPMQPGVMYRAIFRPPDGAPVEATFEIIKPAVLLTTSVEQVYPSAESLPENTLKLYVHFSAPMSRGEAYRRLRLLDDQGQVVELPFLELEEELWDPDGKRLTLLFDPGRIKRGLVPNEQVGPPIVQGHRYTLVIDAAWLDANGEPMKSGYQRQFLVLPPERRPVDLKKWRLKPPHAATPEPLEITFPRAMDRALLERMITVLDAAGHSVFGTINVDREETRWQFTPMRSWKAGAYRVRVDTALEDIAGNKVDLPFDVDKVERVESKIRAKSKTIPFSVK